MSASIAARAVILETAIRLFGQKGYLATTVEDIVQEAKVSKGLVFYHYGTKEGLLHEILREMASTHEKILAAIKEECSAKNRLTQCIHVFLDELQKEPALWKIYYSLQFSTETYNLVQLLVEKPFLESYQSMLQECFFALEVPFPSERAMAFETFRKGIFWQYLSSPGTLQIERMEKLWLDQLAQLCE